MSVGSEWSARARSEDVSPSGISIHTERAVPVGAVCTITIPFFLDGKFSTLRVTGRAVYCILSGTEGFRTGVHFGNPDEAMRHLISRIVES